MRIPTSSRRAAGRDARMRRAFTAGHVSWDCWRREIYRPAALKADLPKEEATVAEDEAGKASRRSPQ